MRLFAFFGKLSLSILINGMFMKICSCPGNGGPGGFMGEGFIGRGGQPPLHGIAVDLLSQTILSKRFLTSRHTLGTSFWDVCIHPLYELL